MLAAGRSIVIVALAGLLVPAVSSPARADNDPAVLRGVQFLRSRIGNSQVGETALIALAMLKADIPPGDKDVAACIAKLRTRFVSGVYNPERRGGHDISEAGAVALALSNLDSEARRAELDAVAKYLISNQRANGCWDYQGRDLGDTSISQYAVLGLWESENGGVQIPPEVWDRAAQWYMSVQSAAGSWNYHRDDPASPETLSMTAAGVGSLLICQRQLAHYRRVDAAASSLLTPLASAGQRVRYDPTTANARIEQAIKRGLAWLGSNFTTSSKEIIGQSAYYGLYGIERIGALADKSTLGRNNWFEQGKRFIQTSQRGDGAWDSTHGDVPNTVWAILFITKSTAKTIRRVDIKHLGAGTLLGGRGLPKDLSNLTIAGGRVVNRPMNGAVEGMLAVLEDPRAESADSALSGLVTRYRVEGPAVLRPQKDRFRKLLTDRDPGLRRVAAWGLSRSGDLDVVPALIETLTDRDEAVVGVARDGLQLLSRKIVGLGPPSPSTPDQRKEAAKRWRAWYATIKPLDLEGQDEDQAPTTAARRPR
jgi:hypothetical protein